MKNNYNKELRLKNLNIKLIIFFYIEDMNLIKCIKRNQRKL